MNISHNKIASPMPWSLASTRLFLLLKSRKEGLVGSKQKLGRTLQELENILGFHKGRLSEGIVVVALLQIPSKTQFELLGYTQVTGHKINDDTFKGLDG